MEPLSGKVVIDTNNYYFERDGRYPELDEGRTTVSEMLAAHLPTSKVVKAFNAIQAAHIVDEGRPAGADDRRALAIAGDDAEAKQVVTDLIDSFGFDVVDAGPLAEGKRFDRDKPAYGAEVGAQGMREAIAAG